MCIRRSAIRVGVLAALILAGCSKPPTQHSRTIPLPTVVGEKGGETISGRLDHFAYDPETHRLFMAAVGNGSLEVIDLDKGELVKSVSDLKHPQGVAIVPSTKQVIVACGGEGVLRAYDTRKLEPKGTCDIGEDADNARFANGYVFVGYGSEKEGAIAMVDPTNLTKVGEVPLKAHPESFQVTPDGARVYVNIPWAKKAEVDGSVVVGDVKAGKVIATWTVPQAARNFPMVLDAEHHRVFVVSRRPAKLVCFDTDKGSVIGEAPCVEDSDDVYRDPATGRIIVIGGGDPGSATVGAIDVFSMGSNGELARLETIPTEPGARTGYYLAEERTVYVGVPKTSAHQAELREYTLSK